MLRTAGLENEQGVQDHLRPWHEIARPKAETILEIQGRILLTGTLDRS